MSEPIEDITWEELVRIEPLLLDLYERAKAVDGSSEHFCANSVWYARFKPTLLLLVGWECHKPEICTQEAWDLAYETIYNALPDCRDCLCM